MAAIAVTVAEAVRAALFALGKTTTPTFVPQRTYWPYDEHKDLSSLKVFVVPLSTRPVGGTRDSADYEVDVSVIVQQQVTPSDTSSIDALMLVVDEIAAAFELGSLSSSTTWMGTAYQPQIDFEELAAKQLFTSALVLTFRVEG